MTPAEEELLHEIDKKGRVEFAGGGREIGAEFLAAQLMREKGCRPRKLTLHQVAVVGTLDLEAGEVGFPVEFERCTFDHAPNVEQATIAGLYLTGCELPGLRASQVRLLDGMALHGCQVNGRVQLTGAHIAGQLDMVDCVIDGPSDGALKADGLRVEQDLYCSGKFRVTGLTHMVGAHIGGQFVCDGATFRNPGEEKALELSGLVVQEHVFWCKGFSAEGEVNLSGADIAGRLVCRDAHFRSPGNTAIRAVGMTARIAVDISKQCTVDGELNLVGCRVDGWMRFTGGRFSNPGGKAINLARVSTALNLVLRKGTVVRGQVCLAGAQIGGTLGAQGGQFLNEQGTAIQATGLKVQGDLSLSVRDSTRFRAKGEVVLSDAFIGGNLDCTGGVFQNRDGDALVARGVRVGRDATLCAPFIAFGRVDFAGASVDGKLDFTGARLRNDGDAVRCDQVQVGHAVMFDKAHATGCVRMCNARVSSGITFVDATLKGSPALKLKGTQVRGQLRLRFAKRPAGPIDLRRVRAGSFADREDDWSDGSRLDEFVYVALLDGSMELRKRLDWLAARPYVPQVYLQLAAVCARAGHRDQAIKVLVAKEDARRKEWKKFPGRLYGALWWILKPTVGYGYRPTLVLGWIAGLLVAGGVIFSLVGRFEPARSGVKEEWYHSWLYTFDLLLPVVSLQHSDLWVPMASARWLSLAFTVVGWVLAICLVTGVGRLFKRDNQ
jgi:hypothetical protein